VLIYPKKWSDTLKKDPSKPNDGRNCSAFSTAARRALMLYVPFRSLSDVSDYSRFLERPSHPEPYDPQDNNDIRWRVCFFHRILRTPQFFAQDIHMLFHGVEENDFHLDVDPYASDDDEWNPTPDIPRRQEQEWQTAARVMVHQMVGQPRDFFGARDIDLLHDWNADIQGYDLPASPDDFDCYAKAVGLRNSRS
jgi:hypothetical protein